MQNFDLNDAMANFLDLGDAARLYDLVLAFWTQCRERAAARRPHRPLRGIWSRTRRPRCARCSPSSACPGTRRCSTIRRHGDEARADRHAELRPGRPADLPPRRGPLGALSRAARAGPADPRALGRADGLYDMIDAGQPPIAPAWPRSKPARRRRPWRRSRRRGSSHPSDARLWHVGGLLHRALGDLAPGDRLLRHRRGAGAARFRHRPSARPRGIRGRPAGGRALRAALRIEPRDSARIGLIEAIQQEQGPAAATARLDGHAGGRSGLDRRPCLSGAARLHRPATRADHRLVRARAGGDAARHPAVARADHQPDPRRPLRRRAGGHRPGAGGGRPPPDVRRQ